MQSSRIAGRWCVLVLTCGLLILGSVCWANTPATPHDESFKQPNKPSREFIDPAKDVGDLVDFSAALAAGADYLRQGQADITDDNAGNGTDGVDETPDDPDDGGWDWSLTDPAFSHSTSASPPNIYGATAQGLLRAYLASSDPALLTSMTDAANFMIGDPGIRSAADLIFLMNYNDLAGVAGTTYMDAAKAKYDGRVVVYGSGAALVEYIRDARAGQGYENGIIAWDNGAWVVAARMLADRYPGDPYDYAADSVAMAEVLWQDSFNDSPGYFDVIDDQGFDPTWTDKNFWWYTLGLSGLIDAFAASGDVVHTAEIPALVGWLLDSQYTNGAVSGSYGANTDDEDWQSTAYVALTLANLDQVTYQEPINWMAYWLGATQHASGGWVYGSGTHYPEIGGEATAALSYGMAPTDVVVDDDFIDQAAVDAYNLANSTSLVWGYDAFDNVQDGVDAVSGSTVTVLAGTYEEQVVIDQDLNLLGAGSGVTTIVCPDTITEVWGSTRKAVIYVHDADNVVIRDLTVDGAGKGNANNVLIGIGYGNAGGGIYDCVVTATRHTPLNGVQGGLGIYLLNDDGTPRSMEIHDCDVSDFQKNGITTNAPGGDALAIDIRDNVVTGAGVLTSDNGDPAQNGIQFWGTGVTGTVAGNTVTGIAWDNTNATTKWVATSILDYYSAVNVLTNTISQAHVGVYKIDGTGQISGNDITIEKIGVYAWGIIGSDPPRIMTSPFGDPAKGRTPDKALLNVVADGNIVTFSGPDNTSCYGIEVDAGYGPDDIIFQATNNTVTGFEAGIEFWMCTSGCDTGVLVSGVANYNTLSGNTHGVRSNFDYTTVNASCNWWGDLSGPDALPANPGTGDAATGDMVYWPWLDAPGGNCDQYGSDNVAALDPVDCITPSNSCVTIPVVFNRTDVTASRGISVTFQLCPKLVLCSGDINADINVATGAGAWSSGFGNLNYQILDNGGGSYTVDQAILGTPCGPTTGGDLFFVDVTLDPGVTMDATAMLFVTDVVVRDCNNVPLPGIPGAPATVIIDLTDPAVLTDLAATQVKAGNDSDGTTKINLTWTAPGGDADFIEIYRKGYGDYPEYDDGTGAPAAAPVTVGNGWTLVTTIAATATSYVDEPANRDYWYYAAYVTDTCGNVSDATGLTGGTLNYHLGDVHDTVTPGAGENLVSTSDISHLGFNYGITLAHAAPLNYLDVGPTADWGVDTLPATDNRVQFEDLMIFALNYGLVSKGLERPAPAAFNLVDLRPGPLPAVGEILQVEVSMSGDGTIQGLSVPLVWNEKVLEPMAMNPGSLLNEQGGVNLVVSPEPGVVDAALFGIREAGISGNGTLATVSFRVKAPGDPGLDLGPITARNKANEDVLVDRSSGEVNGELPLISALEGNVPNPFNPSTKISFVVVQEGMVNLSIYTLRGQLVRTLVNEEMSSGPRSVMWNGIDAEGREVASGIYLMRFQAPDRSMSKQITLVK